MATVTELVDLVCQDTGLASSGTERDIVLARLNHAYRTIVSRDGGVPYEADLTFTDGQNYYDLSAHATLGARFLSIQNVLDSTGSELRHSTRDYCNLRANQSGTTSGAINRWAVEWPNLYVDANASSTVLTVDARLSPLTLEEASGGTGEASPSSLPPAWHEQLLACLATVLVLERYEGREQEAAVHRRTYNEAWQEYLLAKARSGGVNAGIDPYHRDRFILPNRARTRR